MSRPEALKRARELRERFRATHEPFSQSDFHEALLNNCQDLTGSALDGLVAWAAEHVDKTATKETTSQSQPSLPGFDMDGEYKLGSGLRISKPDARLEHMEAMLALDDENLINCQQANLRKRQELLRLRPHLGPGVSKMQAAQAYLAANKPLTSEAGG